MYTRNLIHSTITANLIRVRVSKRYSQERIAQVLDIKQSSYNKMESGHTRISSDQLGILATFYKVDVSDFYRKNIDFNADSISLIEENEKIKIELANQRAFNHILLTRNGELEEKIGEKKL